MRYKPIRDLLDYEESLFRDERVFDLDYIPERFIHRDAQMQEIAYCLLPALRGRRAVNALILGSTATGKTTAVKLRFAELERESERAVCVHINCKLVDTRYGVFAQIYRKLFGHSPPDTGLPLSRLYERIFTKLVGEERSLVVALDDMNYLFYTKAGNDVLYDLLRAPEIFPGAKVAVFGIVSSVDMKLALDPRVSSTFRYREIFFPPYTKAEMFDILKLRAELGFFPGVIEDEIIEKITQLAWEQGDLRVGIELLRMSGVIAEAEASRKIEEEHVERAYKKSRFLKLREIVTSLGDEERILLEVVASQESARSGVIYENFKKRTGLSYTKFYRLVEKLEDLGLLETKFASTVGRSRIIRLRAPQEEILRLIP